MQAPVLIWNFSEGFASFRFHLSDRHGGGYVAEQSAELCRIWEFPLASLLLVSPFIFIAMIRFFAVRLEPGPERTARRLAVWVFWLSTLTFLAVSLFDYVNWWWNLVAYILVMPFAARYMGRRWMLWLHIIYGAIVTSLLFISTAIVPLINVFGGYDWRLSPLYGWEQLEVSARKAVEQYHPDFIASNGPEVASLTGFALDTTNVTNLDARLAEPVRLLVRPAGACRAERGGDHRLDGQSRYRRAVLRDPHPDRQHRHLAVRRSSSAASASTTARATAAVTTIASPTTVPHLRLLQALVAFFVLMRVLYVFFAGPSPDEAYYWLWGQHPGLSYYDHAPFHAWLLGISDFVLGRSLFGLRWMTLATLAGTAWIFRIWAERYAGADWRRWFWPGMVILLASPTFGIFSALAFHDYMLVFLVLVSAHFFLTLLHRHGGEGTREEPRPLPRRRRSSAARGSPSTTASSSGSGSRRPSSPTGRCARCCATGGSISRARSRSRCRSRCSTGMRSRALPRSASTSPSGRPAAG